jgi:hypothetical protein
MVVLTRSIGRPEFRLRSGRGSNKAHKGRDGPGTVEPVDKRSLFRCDPASSLIHLHGKGPYVAGGQFSAEVLMLLELGGRGSALDQAVEGEQHDGTQQ